MSYDKFKSLSVGSCCQVMIFAGVFRARETAAAVRMVHCLSQKVSKLTESRQSCHVLKEAIDSLELPEECSGSAAVITNGQIAFATIGKAP